MSRFTKIGMAVAAVLVLFWVGVTIFTASASTKSDRAAKKDDERYCPHCGRELSKSAIASGMCPYCLMEEGPEKAKLNRRSGGITRGPLIPITLVGIFCALLLTHVVIGLRKRMSGQTDETLYYFTCPCGRRLRYRRSQGGHLARCPLCRKPLIFPRPEDEPETRWLRVRRWLRMMPSKTA
jgi:hypothetical protein